MKPIRLLHIIGGLGTGGAETALLRLCRHSDPDSVTHTVVSLTGRGPIGESLAEAGVEVRDFKLRPGLSLPGELYRLDRIAAQTAPDILHGWMYHGSLLATLLARHAQALVWGIRHCLYAIDDEKPMTRRVIRLCRRLSPRADRITYNSELSRRQHEAFGFASGEGSVIANGFDLDQFRPDPTARQRVREEIGLKDSDRLVGHVGRFHPVKGHATVLRAARRLIQQHDDLHFVFAGRGVERNNAALAPLLDGLPESRIHLLGECRDVVGLLSALDLFCQSSGSEAFPNALGEAMSVQLPCVATDVGDTRRLLGDAGKLLAPGDDLALAEAIGAILAMPEQELRELGLKARTRIEQRFGMSAYVENHLQMYRSLSRRTEDS